MIYVKSSFMWFQKKIRPTLANVSLLCSDDVPHYKKTDTDTICWIGCVINASFCPHSIAVTRNVDMYLLQQEIAYRRISDICFEFCFRQRAIYPSTIETQQN